MTAGFSALFIVKKQVRRLERHAVIRQIRFRQVGPASTDPVVKGVIRQKAARFRRAGRFRRHAFPGGHFGRLRLSAGGKGHLLRLYRGRLTAGPIRLRQVLLPVAGGKACQCSNSQKQKNKNNSYLLHCSNSVDSLIPELHTLFIATSFIETGESFNYFFNACSHSKLIIYPSCGSHIPTSTLCVA